MRVGVTGAGGMLGRAVVEALAETQHDVAAWDHAHLDITDLGACSLVLEASKREVIINCAGLRWQDERATPIEMMRVNAVGPHILAEAARVHHVRILHISTDCVYSGKSGYHGERPVARKRYDRADPIDDYGRSKLAGEVKAPWWINLRTSFVGPDHGLWAWAAAEAAAGNPVAGWDRAFWSGSTVWAVAAELAALVEREDLQNVEHLSTPVGLSKAAVLKRIGDATGMGLKVIAERETMINRALYPSIQLQKFDEALADRSAW